MPHLFVSQKTNGFDTSHPQNDAHPLAMNILEWTSVCHCLSSEIFPQSHVTLLRAILRERNRLHRDKTLMALTR